MKTVLIFAACGIFSLAGCIQVDPVSEDALDLGRVGSSPVRFGSGQVRPADNWAHENVEDREVFDPYVYEYEDLPLHKISQIKKLMTQEEVQAILGHYDREDVELQNLDTDGNDYNAMIHTWRYTDRRHASQPLRRDFEIRYAWVHNERSFPLRPEIVGPAWVVMRIDLN